MRKSRYPGGAAQAGTLRKTKRQEKEKADSGEEKGFKAGPEPLLVIPGEEILKIISTLCKQRHEAIEQFRKGGRTDLVEKEEAELEILRRFLPEALSEDEVRALIRASIEEIGARGVQDRAR